MVTNKGFKKILILFWLIIGLQNGLRQLKKQPSWKSKSLNRLLSFSCSV